MKNINPPNASALETPIFIILLYIYNYKDNIYNYKKWKYLII